MNREAHQRSLTDAGFPSELADFFRFLFPLLSFLPFLSLSLPLLSFSFSSFPSLLSFPSFFPLIHPISLLCLSYPIPSFPFFSLPLLAFLSVQALARLCVCMGAFACGGALARVGRNKNRACVSVGAWARLMAGWRMNGPARGRGRVDAWARVDNRAGVGEWACRHVVDYACVCG